MFEVFQQTNKIDNEIKHELCEVEILFIYLFIFNLWKSSI